MTVSSKVMNSFFYISYFVFAIVLFVPDSGFSTVLPEREIVVIEGSSPEWKSHWDIGRQLARNGDLVGAAEQYEQLLSVKPQVEAAKWEYCQILFELGSYDLLPAYLEWLIEADQNNLNYLAMAGYVSLHEGDYEKAKKYLGKVYSARPEGESGVAALSGLIEALNGLGLDVYVFPLMEQLYLRQPNDNGLLIQLGDMAHELGFHQKAKEYYQLLMGKTSVPDTVLINASEAMYEAGDKTGAVRLWQEIVRKKPLEIEYLEKLADYYQEINQPELALPYILSLIEHKPDFSPDLLLTAGRIYFYDIHKADKALRLFERYLESMPKHHEVGSEIRKVRERISSDLLAIVENASATILWSDLQKITEDPLLLFNMMADKLEQQEKYEPAIELLRIIYTHSDNQDKVALRLARLYDEVGNSIESYRAFLLVNEDVNRDQSYYERKLDFEKELGLSRAALSSSLKLLEMKPDSLNLRIDSIRMAGEIGLMEELKKASQSIHELRLDGKDLDLYLTYGKSLVQVGAYSKADQLYTRLLQEDWSQLKLSRQVKLAKAELLAEQGLFFEQQQIYRQLLTESGDDFEVIRLLIESTIFNSPSINCRPLLTMMKKVLEQTEDAADFSRFRFLLALTEASILEKEKNIGEAISILEKASATLQHAKTAKGRALRLLKIDTELFRLYIQSEQYDKGHEIISRYPKREKRVLTIRFMKNVSENRGQFQISSFLHDTKAAHNPSGRLTSLFKAARFAEQFGFTDEGIALIDEVLRREPESRRALVQKARILMKNGLLDEGTLLFEKLAAIYPQDPYYVRVGLELAMKKGLYNDVAEATSYISGEDLPVQPLMIRARALWGAGREEESLKVYRQILTKSVNDDLQHKLAEHSVVQNSLHAGKEKSPFWGLFYYDLGNRLDNLNALNNKDGFLALLGTEEGQIVADLYSRYRYEKMLTKEYQARKAIVEKRYVAAKKQYQRNLKEEESSEGLKDLAKIYERLGDYGKEAEIYSVIAQKGEKTPEIEESIKRNERIRSPSLAVNYVFNEQDGREGAKNIIREEGGLGLKFYPGLSSEVELLYHELSYRPVDETETVEGRLMRGFGKWDVLDTTTVTYDFGIHILDDEGDTTLLYDLRVDHRFEENLKGYMSLEQALVDDSLDSLRQAIDSRNINIGFVVDGESGFVVGTELTRRSYSDENDQNRFYLWSSYSIFSDYTTIAMKYSYEFLANGITGDVETDPDTGEKSYSMAYWSPEDYWVHRASLTFTHLLRHFEGFKQEAGQYSLNFTIGYESEENFLYSTKFDIFLEMSDHFLLKGDLLYEMSNDYDESKAAFSLIYRW
ncbi:tetratricopeptide repeat protein [Desulfopila sp. IMCC35008]|uniref:tetratricopeptide repeat protein n=1 Tax=Desulfopila sp. IMCC35008 TaxID=2653858 RepID=UPI0013D77A3C|nr:tetratricopeptide repeat protein [Desulfopila sp. IMCC35008]